MANLSPLPLMIFWDELGRPLSDGSTLTTYIAGTTTPTPTYTDQSGNIANPNPLDLLGSPGTPIWFRNGAYKLDVKDSEGMTLPGYPVDNVIVYDQVNWSGLTATILELNATDTSTFTVITDYTAILSNRGKTILCNATSAAFTVNLPSASSATNGYEITIKKIDVSTNIVTIDGNGGELIEGRLTFLLYDQNDVVTLLCDGNNWRVKSGVIRGNTQLISTTYTATISDINKLFICSATVPYTVTLLSAVTAGDGFKIGFKKSSDLNAITIAAAGMETIDGLSNIVISDDYQVVNLESNGSNWYIISDSGFVSGITGEIKFLIDTIAPNGWIHYSEGTIGNAVSGATIRANGDTLNLFTKIWNTCSNNNCPVSGGRGASAADDFSANKTIFLPKGPGRVLGVTGTSTVTLTFTVNTGTDILTVPSNMSLYTGTPIQVSTTGTLPSPLLVSTTYYVIFQSSTTIQLAASLADAHTSTAIDITTVGTGIQSLTVFLQTYGPADYAGEIDHVLTLPESPPHTHQYVGFNPINPATTGGDSAELPENDVTSSSGGGLPHNNVQPSVFLNAYIKL